MARLAGSLSLRPWFITLVYACQAILWTADLFADDQAITRVRVDDLIRGLDAGTLIERSRAERQLLELGPEVLRLLPASELVETMSAREAIRRIRPQLERRAARDSSAASLVSLQATRTLKEILEQIQLQTQNRISLADDANAPVVNEIQVDWNKTHFWDCLDDLCDRYSLYWRFAKDAAAKNSQPIETLQSSMSILPRRDLAEIRVYPEIKPISKARAVQRIGPFRLSVINVEIRPVVGDERQRIIRVSGRLSVEPRLRPLFLKMTDANVRAIADEDRPLPAWNPDAKYEFPVSETGRDIPIQWDFRLFAKMEVKTLSIRGRMQCQIAAATERVVFDQTSQVRGTIRRRGGVSVRLRHVNFEPIEKDAVNADIGITVSYDNGGPAFESHRSWIFHNAVYLETKAGVRTDFTDFEITQQADGAVAVDYHWQKIAPLADQYLFVYEAPTLIIDVPVDVDVGEIAVAK